MTRVRILSMPWSQGIAGAVATPPVGNSFFISPTGSFGNLGTLASPWSWDRVLTGTAPAAIQPGDTVWCLGGTYTIDRRGISGDYTITTALHGSPSQPIVVRAYQTGRPVFDLIANRVAPNNDLITWILGGGEYTWFWGLEWTCSSWPNGRTSTLTGSDAPSDVAGAGVTVRINSANAGDEDVGIKVIHCLVHDTISNGFSSQSAGGLGSEVYGSMQWNNGWVGSDRGHQHGVYNQNANANPTKLWESNIVLCPFGNGLQFFGTAVPAQNLLANDNIVALPSAWADHFASGELLTTSSDNDLLVFRRNLTWLPRGIARFGNRVNSFGSQLTTNEGSVTVEDNVLFGDTGASGFATFTFNRNRCVGGRTGTPGNEVWIIEYYQNPAAVEAVNTNEYYNNGNDTTPFHRLNQGGGGLIQYTFAEWQANLGFDAAGSYSAGIPTTNWVYVKPTTRYEANRGHVVIYNWQGLSSQAVDLSPILNVGQSYEVWELFTNPRYVGTPFASGTYSGGTVNFALTSRNMVLPNGWGLGAGETEAPTNENEFHVFLVRGL